MNFISFSEYQNENNVYTLRNILVGLNIIPKNLFITTAVVAARRVEHFLNQQDLFYFSFVMETVEKYLAGELTAEKCEFTARDYRSKIRFDHTSPASWAEEAAISTVLAASCPTIHAAAHVADVARLAATALRETQPTITGADIFREGLPWAVVCACQIQSVLGRYDNDQITRINQLSKNTQLIDYATIILSEEGLREEFEFLIKEFNPK